MEGKDDERPINLRQDGKSRSAVLCGHRVVFMERFRGVSSHNDTDQGISKVRDLFRWAWNVGGGACKDASQVSKEHRSYHVCSIWTNEP